MSQVIAQANLSLGGLGMGVGANGNTSSETKLAADGRGANTETKMSQFFCGDFTGLSSATLYNGGNWYHQGAAQGYSDRHFKIDTYAGLTSGYYNWQETGSLFFSRLAEGPGNINWPTNYVAINPGYVSSYTGDGQVFNITMNAWYANYSTWSKIRTSYRDHYNTGATNYNTSQDATVNIQGQFGRSDIRLKENIQKLGTSPSGIPVYSFKYKGESTYYKGTIAQDLLNIGRQDAVTLMDDGYYGVYYNKLDISHEIFNGF